MRKCDAMTSLRRLFGAGLPTIRGKIFIEDVMLEPKPGDARTVFRIDLKQLGLMPGYRLWRVLGTEQKADRKDDADTIIQLIWDLLRIGYYQGASQQALVVLCEVRIIHNKPVPTIIGRKVFKGSSPRDKIVPPALRYQKSVLGDVPWSEIEQYLRTLPLDTLNPCN